MPSFIKIKNKVRKKIAICEDRNPESVEAHRLFKERLSQQ